MIGDAVVMFWVLVASGVALFFLNRAQVKTAAKHAADARNVMGTSLRESVRQARLADTTRYLAIATAGLRDQEERMALMRLFHWLYIERKFLTGEPVNQNFRQN